MKTQARLYYYEATFPFDDDPLLVAAQVVRSSAHDDYVLYEHEQEWSIGLGSHARVTVFPDRAVIEQNGGEEVLSIEDKSALSDTIQAALAKFSVEGWRVYGTATFELARFIHGLPTASATPLLTLFIPAEEVRIHKHLVILRALKVESLRSLEAIVHGTRSDNFAALTALDLKKTIADYGAESYKDNVQSGLEEIWSHKYRKVILSRRVDLPQKLDMLASYVVGRRANQPARSYALRIDGLEAAGFSPETVAEVTPDGDVFTTPLAGTRSTGDNLTQEFELREELVSDSKEIAEHAISVYAAFNDLALACEPASIRVVNFMIVARRGAVQHLASRLTGKLLPQHNSWHAFNALFPAVTASGVWKREAVEAIGRIEPQPRELYSGCVMVCDQNGALDAALILRSFYQHHGKAWLQAGAGIMNMSNPDRELEETREKLMSLGTSLIGAS